jgi:hypothetical protein
MDIVNSIMIGLWSFVLALTPFVMAALTMLLSGATVESVYEHTLAAIFKAIAEKFKSAGGWIKGAQPLLVLALSIGTAYALGVNYIPSGEQLGAVLSKALAVALANGTFVAGVSFYLHELRKHLNKAPLFVMFKSEPSLSQIVNELS